MICCKFYKCGAQHTHIHTIVSIVSITFFYWHVVAIYKLSAFAENYNYIFDAFFFLESYSNNHIIKHAENNIIK